MKLILTYLIYRLYISQSKLIFVTNINTSACKVETTCCCYSYHEWYLLIILINPFHGFELLLAWELRETSRFFGSRDKFGLKLFEPVCWLSFEICARFSFPPDFKSKVNAQSLNNYCSMWETNLEKSFTLTLVQKYFTQSLYIFT